jgi:hypothetical protein
MGSTLQFGLLSTVGGMNVGRAISTPDYIVTGSTLYARHLNIQNSLNSPGTVSMGGVGGGALTIDANSNIRLNGGGLLTTVIDTNLTVNGTTSFQDFTINRDLTVNCNFKIFNLSSVNGPAFFYSTVFFGASVSIMSTTTVSTLIVTGRLQASNFVLTGPLNVPSMTTNGFSNTGRTDINLSNTPSQYIVTGTSVYFTTNPTGGSGAWSENTSFRNAAYASPVFFESNWYIPYYDTPNSTPIIGKYSTLTMSMNRDAASRVRNTNISGPRCFLILNSNMYLGDYGSGVFTIGINTFPDTGVNIIGTACNSGLNIGRYFGIATNGRRVVAVGTPAQFGYSSNYTIMYSDIPFNWAISANTFSNDNTTNNNNRGTCVVWNGQMFVAGAAQTGSGLARIKYSYDGANWIDSTFTTSNVLAIAWNGKRFAAVTTGTGTSVMIYSEDAINWRTGSGSASFATATPRELAAISWSGTFFLATMADTGGNNIKISSDGITWANIILNTGTATTAAVEASFGSAFSQNYYPDLDVAGIDFFSKQQPPVVSTSNFILAHSNGISINNNNLFVSCNVNTDALLGVGTANPGRTVEVQSLINTYIRITSQYSRQNAIEFFDATSNITRWIIYRQINTDELRFWTASPGGPPTPGDRFILTPAGNLTITGTFTCSNNNINAGTGSLTCGAITCTTITTNGNTINTVGGTISCGPLQCLNITATQTITGQGFFCTSLTTNGGAITSGAITSGAITSGAITCTTITTNGNTIDAGTGAITCGSLTATGNVTAYSDKRLKTNVTPVENALDKVNAMRGVTFNLKSNPDGKRNLGVIAQEIEEVLPEVVHTDDSDKKLKSVAYGNLVAVLIEAVKELSAKVETLEKKILEKV